MYHFYSVIIGTELLNGRRVDKHFSFLNQELQNRGLKHMGSFVIQDSPALLKNCFSMILQDPKSVMFCFGGLGATPDDLTRSIVSEVFTGEPLFLHVKAKELIEQQFGAEAYPHRINMAMLPPRAKLLNNVINNVPGFSLFDRFFFTPGFPSMAWPMITNVLNTYFPHQRPLHAISFIVESSENDLIEIMEALPTDLHFSSLPHFEKGKASVEIYLAHEQKEILHQWEHFFQTASQKKGKLIRKL